jgi:hypothetical protein
MLPEKLPVYVHPTKSDVFPNELETVQAQIGAIPTKSEPCQTKSESNLAEHKANQTILSQ